MHAASKPEVESRHWPLTSLYEHWLIHVLLNLHGHFEDQLFEAAAASSTFVLAFCPYVRRLGKKRKGQRLSLGWRSVAQENCILASATVIAFLFRPSHEKQKPPRVL